MAGTKQLGDKSLRKRRLKHDQPDSEWTYTPPPLSEQAERFLTWWVEQHPLTSERGFTVFLHVPLLRQILFWLEQPESGPTEAQRQRAGGYETNAHVASHADLLMFGAGTRAEQERVFIELVEGMALLAFAPGRIPRLPHLPQPPLAHQMTSRKLLFKKTEEQKLPELRDMPIPRRAVITQSEYGCSHRKRYSLSKLPRSRRYPSLDGGKRVTMVTGSIMREILKGEVDMETDSSLPLHPCYEALWREMLRIVHEDWRAGDPKRQHPHISYAGQWTGLRELEVLPDDLLAKMIAMLMYEVNEERHGPRCSCADCVFFSLLLHVLPPAFERTRGFAVMLYELPRLFPTK